MAFETLWLASDGAGAVTYTAAEWRHVLGTMFTVGTVTGHAVSQQASPNMTVQVSAGRTLVPPAANEGPYLAVSTGVENSPTFGAAPVTVGQSRNDILCLKTNDPAASGGSAGRNTVLVVVAGTAAATGSQVDPSIPAFHQPLARVTIPYGAANISAPTCTITDLRTWALAVGDIIDDANATRLGTDAATAGAVVRRDGSGRAKFAAPSASTDAATKGYADGLGTALGVPDTIVRRDAGGRIGGCANPVATTDAVNKAYADGLGTALGVPDTIVRRTTVDGRIAVGTPTGTADATNKAYVDGLAAITEGSTGTVKWFKQGRSVTVFGYLADSDLAQLPGSVWPLEQIDDGARNRQTGNPGTVTISTAGFVNTSRTDGAPSDEIGFSATYLTT